MDRIVTAVVLVALSLFCCGIAVGTALSLFVSEVEWRIEARRARRQKMG